VDALPGHPRDPWGHQDMLTQIKNSELVAAETMAAERARAAAEPATEGMQNLMVQVARQGLDISLRSLQVWADLARQFGPTALCSPAHTRMIVLTCDLFEKLLVAQRQVVEELIATQRQLAQQFLETTISAGNDLARR
jgi:hypothetical protein